MYDQGCRWTMLGEALCDEVLCTEDSTLLWNIMGWVKHFFNCNNQHFLHCKKRMVGLTRFCSPQLHLSVSPVVINECAHRVGSNTSTTCVFFSKYIPGGLSKTDDELCEPHNVDNTSRIIRGLLWVVCFLPYWFGIATSPFCSYWKMWNLHHVKFSWYMVYNMYLIRPGVVQWYPHSTGN